jgi:hypothetical protein
VAREAFKNTKYNYFESINVIAVEGSLSIVKWDHKNSSYSKSPSISISNISYLGESKIIRNVGTCFAVGYTAGWA